MKVFSKFLRAPLFHFFLIGTLLFALKGLLTNPFTGAVLQETPKILVVSAEEVEQLKKDLTVQQGALPTPRQIQAAVDDFINEEILFQQAQLLGLDQNNSAIRQRLIQLAKFLSEDPQQNDEALYHQALELGLDKSDLVVRRQMATLMKIFIEKIPTRQAPAQITESDLEVYYNKHSENFLSPEKWSYSQVFFSKDRRGMAAKKNAEQAFLKFKLKKIKASEATSWGDPFLGGHEFISQSSSAVEKTFGPEFANQFSKLQEGSWAGPIASGYGWHLVWLNQRVEPLPLSMTEVRNQLHHGIQRERREKRFQDALTRLRSQYSVQVESPHFPQGKKPTERQDG